MRRKVYCLQRASYSALYGARFLDAIDDEHAVGAQLTRDPDPGAVLHVPTWLLPMVPDRSVSLIVAAHVLQELPGATLRYVLAQFKRVVAPGGLLYMRDKEFWTPMHRVRVGRGEDTSRHFQHARRLKRIFLPSYGLSWRSWRDCGLPI